MAPNPIWPEGAGAKLEFQTSKSTNQRSRSIILPPIITTFPDCSQNASLCNTDPTASIEQHVTVSQRAVAASPESSPTSTASPQLESCSDGTFQTIPKSSSQSLVATTTVGGTILLALLVYALWKRNHHVSCMSFHEIGFPNSITRIAKQRPRDQRLTALPIHNEKRYRVNKLSLHSVNRHDKRTNRFLSLFLDCFQFCSLSRKGSSEPSSTPTDPPRRAQLKNRATTLNPIAPHPNTRDLSNLLWPLEKSLREPSTLHCANRSHPSFPARTLSPIPERLSWWSNGENDDDEEQAFRNMPEKPAATAFSHYRSVSAISPHLCPGRSRQHVVASWQKVATNPPERAATSGSPSRPMSAGAPNAVAAAAAETTNINKKTKEAKPLPLSLKNQASGPVILGPPLQSLPSSSPSNPRRNPTDRSRHDRIGSLSSIIGCSSFSSSYYSSPDDPALPRPMVQEPEPELTASLSSDGLTEEGQDSDHAHSRWADFHFHFDDL